MIPQADQVPLNALMAATMRSFKSFFLNYIAHQQQAIESIFRTDLATLDARWKKYVLAQAERLRAQQGEPESRSRRRNR